MKTFTIDQYAIYLAQAGRRLNPRLQATMTRAGLNIRDDWRSMAAAKNPTHAVDYPNSITMRRIVVIDDRMTVTVEPVGYGQANLGRVLEYGGGKIKSSPQTSNIEALDNEEPVLLGWLKKILEDTL